MILVVYLYSSQLYFGSSLFLQHARCGDILIILSLCACIKPYQNKRRLKKISQGECFEKVMFQSSLLQKYFHVLISENWIVMDWTPFFKK